MPLLGWLVLMPFAMAIVMLAFPRVAPRTLKRIAFILTLIPLGTLVTFHAQWEGSTVQVSWMPALSIQLHLGIDALSLVFLYLTALIIPVSLLAIHSRDATQPHTFYGLVFLLEGLLFGFFTARDLIVFTIFYEAMLLPLYFIINMWGGQARRHAALKFLIYMIAGSVLMVVAALALYFASEESFAFTVLQKVAGGMPYAPWLCAVFLLAFAVKTPLFPFHAWLPDAYYHAPTSGTILLSALLSKAGIYGILRIGIGFFPEIVKAWNPYLVGFAIAGVFYGALAAWMQRDFKRLIAYSSLSHVNFILVGLFVGSSVAVAGAILQSVNHGITIAALFLVAGWLEERLGSTAIGRATGVARSLPYLCWLTLFFVLSSVALPGLNNFIGELLILFGLFGQNPWLTALLGITVILSVVYMLRWMQKVYFEIPSPVQPTWQDIRLKEMLFALPLIFLIVWIGVYPGPVMKTIQPAADKVEGREL